MLRGRPLLAGLVACGDELAEERVWLEGLRFELGMELAAEEVGVAGDFYDLDVGGVGGCLLYTSRCV